MESQSAGKVHHFKQNRTHQCKLSYSPKPRSKDSNQLKGWGMLTVWEDFLEWGENVKHGWLLSQLRWMKQAYLTIEAESPARIRLSSGKIYQLD